MEKVFRSLWAILDPSHSAAAVRRASELLDIKHVFDSADPGHQTGALKRAGHILHRLKAGYERKR